jgi:cobaltochelatase CobS
MSEEMISCQICGDVTHLIASHLSTKHPEVSVEQYEATFPLAPLMSERAKEAVRAAKEKKPAESVFKAEATGPAKAVRNFFHEVFGLDVKNKLVMSARGTPIGVKVLDKDILGDAAVMIPAVDNEYVYDINLTKTVVMGFEMNIPVYLHGHAGVGKTTLYEQVAARTNRPYIRVQHTANMEEADVEGRWIVNAEGKMEFMNGPLTDAMELGAVYCADEYDFASPMVLSVYQAVLEGKPLFIKAANKKVYPHPNFRFAACGNTNGAGDESGLYQGTMIQNAANYERFGIVERVNYMPEKNEIAILTGKTTISEVDATNIVRFATKMREGFDSKNIAMPMSPRSTLNAAKLGVAKADMAYGITCAYINRLPDTSAAAARSTMQRIFGAS